MSSGLTPRGGPNRCYGFYADLMNCEENPPTFTKEDKMAGKMHPCAMISEDYFECLHGRKLRKRIAMIQAEEARQKKEAALGKAAH